MNSEIITGYIGQVFDECDVDSKALSLLQELYDMASDELTSEKKPETEPSPIFTIVNLSYEELVYILKDAYTEDRIKEIEEGLNIIDYWTDGKVTVIRTKRLLESKFALVSNTIFTYHGSDK